MYLRSLEMQGFKSFPDKTRLDFTKGITAVVGPNGSGKSNISDAMRWVMGEQSSKALRGEKMSGVIFHGCETRKESPFSQVTLTIDNSDRALGIDEDLVAVSRKLYKNGDSEYMINGSSVRLKEVNELFMDTGLGKDGYSIIGQGRIAEIVSGKGTDRREILEEAAGIAKLRYKKVQAEKKLAETEDKLTRVNDILSEHEARLPALEKQCEKARKFKVLDDEKSSLEISVWLSRLEQYRRTLADYEEKIKLLKVQHRALSAELEDTEKAIADELMESARALEESDRLKQEIHDTEMQERSGEAEIAVCKNDIEHIKEKIVSIREQAERSKADKFFLESELKERQEELERLRESRDAGDERASAKEDELTRLMSDSEESDKAVAKANADISAAYIRKSDLSFRCESAAKTIAEVSEQLSLLEKDSREAGQNLKLARSDLQRLEKDRAKNQESREENENRIGGLTKLLESRTKKLEDTERRLGETENELRTISGRLQILNDLERSMEGFGASVKTVMNAARQGRLSGVCGTVAQLISAEPKYLVAVETALGGALQNIVTENEDIAKRGIKLLKETGRGRATFLPLTSVKGSRADSSTFEGMEGYVAMGVDIVSFEDRYSGIFGSLLGRVCIAEDIDAAAKIAKKTGFRTRIVTLDGQVVNAGGSFTGGSVSKSTGILTRKNEIESLTKRQGELDAEKAGLCADREKYKNETAKLSADCEGVRETISSLCAEQIRLDMEIKRVSEFMAAYEKDLEQGEEARRRYAEKTAQAEKEKAQAAEELEKILGDISAMEDALVNTIDRQNSFKQQRQAMSEELSAIRIENAELMKDIEACKSSIEQLRESIESSDGDSGRFTLEIAAEEKKIADKQAQIESVTLRINGTGSRIEELTKLAEEARQRYSDHEDQAGKIRSEQRIKLNEKEELSTRITRGEERCNAVSGDFDALAAKLWDEYELTRSTAGERAVEIHDMQEAEKRLSELKNKIKALGSVNLGAIEEYAELREKYDFLTSQLRDVTTSKKELLEMIDSLTNNMKTMFIQKFDAINNNFRHIFAELFGGGKGELVLSDPEDVLECGIDVTVQPPGKVITSLMSLSGGEQALAAIAIYFAILKNSPSPFCLLDEIEAALDDVNVVRYAQYLHKLTDRTQFITITHRRGTMEEADVLYGVTMQEKGISKMLKMDLTTAFTLNS
ncbi:MAG: chromosome segregation protein SMC [Ruminococcus sp.]|nr:chromosome segregation protein SMC [Ruminococcus sp.]